METTRQQKIARLLQKELGDIFLQYARRIQGTIITVTGVTVSPDLSIARIRLSIFPADKVAPVMGQVEAETKTFRYELGKRVRHQLRIIPELFFYNDDSLDYLENIDNLLKSDPIIHPEDHDYGMDEYKD
ncbi:MAG TPA: 30S ribosome-binding factor RbfA [Bacteroidales bacterium]|nr:30S ribosome-binding factor RbfA [Bacteroidales bacterium]